MKKTLKLSKKKERWVGAVVTSSGSRMEASFNLPFGCDGDFASGVFIGILEHEWDIVIVGNGATTIKGDTLNLAVRKLE